MREKSSFPPDFALADRLGLSLGFTVLAGTEKAARSASRRRETPYRVRVTA
jgi:hypothetical protein